MSYMKGISLPVNAVVVIGLAVLVLVAVAAFFTTGSGGQLSELDARREFTVGCQNFCESAPENYALAARLPTEHKKFYAACQRLYNVGDYPNRCLEQCGCDMNMTEQDLQANRERLEMLADREINP